MLILANKFHNAVANGGSHLNARPLCAERKPRQEGKKSGDRQKEQARNPFEAENAANGGNGGGNSATLAAMGEREYKARRESEKGSAEEEKR